MTGTNDIAYALAALVFYGLGDIVYKRAALSGLRSDYFLTGQAWCFTPTLLIYAFLTGKLVWAPSALWGCVAGFGVLFGFYNFSASLRHGAVSTIAPIFRLNFLVTAALAMLILHEPVTTRAILGFILAILAGWLLLGGSRSGDPAAIRRSLAQVAIATLATGAGSFFHKLSLMGGATPETSLVAQAIVFFTGMTTMTIVRNRSARLPRGFWKHSGPAAAALFGGFLFMLHGLAHGNASVVVPIAQMGFVVAAVLGLFLFREKLTMRKAGGLASAVAALALIASG